MAHLKDTKSTEQDRSMTENLVDIRTVQVDKSLPREQRIAEFVRQIGNPYCFRCGDFVVRARYAQDGVSLEDRLQSLIE